MSDDFSARLALPYLSAGQMQKHVTMNAALTRLDALLQTVVVSRTKTVQPTQASDGDLYILPVKPQGAAWISREPGALMRFEDGGWVEVPTPEGLIALVLDERAVVLRAIGKWVLLGERLAEVQDLQRLGLGATADAANPLAAKINAALFTALGVGEGGDGDLRFNLNKETTGDVLSLLFQSGASARAELGLIGNDDLSLKVCDASGAWRTVFRADRATGRIEFDRGALRQETTILTSDADYAPPPWARWIEATCIGGGGGGGSGSAGQAGTVRFGGGGGGAGGMAQGRWAASDLGSGLAITVGAGGSGGSAGGETRLSASSAVLLRATGGAAGSAGTANAGAGGAGGLGLRSANSGGGSSISGTSGAGGDTVCPDGPGGGGGGGGLSAADVARAGGMGGSGVWCGLRAVGGLAGTTGQACADPSLTLAGGGGGGGSASANGAGAAGGAGGSFGAGGGGGGGGLTAGGVGGRGAPGVVCVRAFG